MWEVMRGGSARFQEYPVISLKKGHLMKRPNSIAHNKYKPDRVGSPIREPNTSCGSVFCNMKSFALIDVTHRVTSAAMPPSDINNDKATFIFISRRNFIEELSMFADIV